MKTLFQDLRYGWRMLARNPGFTFIAALSLALGIGATTAIFSLVDRLLVRSLPVERPEQLVAVEADTVNPRFHNTIFSYADYADYRDQNNVFSGMSAFSGTQARMGEGAEAKRISIELVSGNYFDLLGVRAARGRMIGEEDDRTPGAHPVVVLSDGLWRRHFGADPQIVGRAIALNGESYTVIGVAPRGFHGLVVESGAELWAPLMMGSKLASQLGEKGFSTSDRRNMWLRIVARMKEGVEIAQAQASLDALARSIWEAHTMPALRNLPFSEKRMVLAPAGKGLSYLRNQLDSPLRTLLVATIAVLLIACANVATLLLGRATARRKEIAVRLALGASRAQIIRQLLTESLVLAAIGGAAGWMLSHWFYDLLLGYQPERLVSQPIFQAGIDPRTLLFAILATVASGLLFGLAPALQSSRPDLIPALKESETSMGGRERRASLRRLLVVAQVAAAVVILVGAGLFVRSLRHLFSIDPGFRAEGVLLVPVEIPSKRSPERGAQFIEQLLERVKARPDVIEATTAMTTPMNGSSTRRSILIEGYEPPPGENIAIECNIVGEDYHRLLGIPILRGRGFSSSDDRRAPGVVLINEAMARTYFPGEDPVGKRISYGPGMPWLEIVGVTRDVRLQHLAEPSEPYFEEPSRQRDYSGYATLMVRTRGQAIDLLPVVRREAEALDPEVVIQAASTLERDLLKSLSTARMAASLTSVFGAVALVLSIIGLYGVTSYAVSRRTREIGIRIALGAEKGDILRLALGEGLVLVAAGEAIGIVAAYALTRMIASQLHGVGAHDPLTFIASALLLAAVAFAATLIPARRAARVNPIAALRYE